MCQIEPGSSISVVQELSWGQTMESGFYSRCRGKISGICGSHNSANDESSLLGCYTVATDTRLRTFRRSSYQSTRRNIAEGVDLERQHGLQ